MYRTRVPVSCVPYPRRRAAHTRRRAPASCVSYARIARAYRHHHRLPDRCLKSDCDEELLIHIVFVQKVRLSGIQIKAPGGPGPKSVKLIVNVPSLDVEPQMLSNPSPSRSPSPNQTPSLDFDSAKSTKVTQEVELSQEGVVSNAKVGRTLLTHLLTYSPTHLLTYLPTYLLTYLLPCFPASLLTTYDLLPSLLPKVELKLPLLFLLTSLLAYLPTNFLLLTTKVELKLPLFSSVGEVK
jgi:hypothetical protein